MRSYILNEKTMILALQDEPRATIDQHGDIVIVQGGAVVLRLKITRQAMQLAYTLCEAADGRCCERAPVERVMEPHIANLVRNRCIRCEGFVEQLEPWREATDESASRCSSAMRTVQEGRARDRVGKRRATPPG